MIRRFSPPYVETPDLTQPIDRAFILEACQVCDRCKEEIVHSPQNLLHDVKGGGGVCGGRSLGKNPWNSPKISLSMPLRPFGQIIPLPKAYPPKCNRILSMRVVPVKPESLSSSLTCLGSGKSRKPFKSPRGRLTGGVRGDAQA